MEKAEDVPVYIPKWMLLIITKEEDILRKDIAFRPTANSVSSYNSKRTKGKIFSLDSSPIPGKGKKMRRQRRSRLEKLIYICSLWTKVNGFFIFIFFPLREINVWNVIRRSRDGLLLSRIRPLTFSLLSWCHSERESWTHAISNYRWCNIPRPV